MYIDLNDPKLDINKKQNNNLEEPDEAFNVPFNLYVEGSYFGDSDCLHQRKCIRECMAEAD